MTIPSTSYSDNQTLHVRALSEADTPAFHALCDRDPLRLLTIRLNIEAYGFAGPTVQTWGAFTTDPLQPQEEMRGALLRFSNTMIAVDLDGACGNVLGAVIDEEEGLAGVRGTVETVREVRAVLRRYVPTHWEDSVYMRLLGPPTCPRETLALARRATPDDLEMLAALYGTAGTMYRSRANIANKLATSRVFVVEEPPLGRRPARIAACALLGGEGRDAGLIGGVYTLPAARGKGYAGACTAALALDLQGVGKLPCLFYENPVAGRVYRRLGFEESGHWAVLYIARTGASYRQSS